MLGVTALAGFGGGGDASLPIGIDYLSVQGSTSNAATYNLTGFGILASHAGKKALVMIASFDADDPEVPATVTVGGASATKLEGQATGTGEGDEFNEQTNGSIWIATLGSSPTDTVDALYATPQANCYAAVFILSNANATAHDTDWTTTNGAASLVSTTLDVVKDGAVFFLGVRKSYTPTGNVDNGLTEHDDVNMESGFGGMLIASKAINATASGEAFRMSTGTNNGNLIAVAVSLEAA